MQNTRDSCGDLLSEHFACEHAREVLGLPNLTKGLTWNGYRLWTGQVFDAYKKKVLAALMTGKPMTELHGEITWYMVARQTLTEHLVVCDHSKHARAFHRWPRDMIDDPTMRSIELAHFGEFEPYAVMIDAYQEAFSPILSSEFRQHLGELFDCARFWVKNRGNELEKSAIRAFLQKFKQGQIRVLEQGLDLTGYKQLCGRVYIPYMLLSYAMKGLWRWTKRRELLADYRHSVAVFELGNIWPHPSNCVTVFPRLFQGFPTFQQQISKEGI